MTKADRIISELMDALELIKREAEQPIGKGLGFPYISGVCEGAMRRCNRERERNSDGYLVVKP